MWTELETKYNDREPHSSIKRRYFIKKKKKLNYVLHDKCDKYEKYCILIIKKSS